MVYATFINVYKNKVTETEKRPNKVLLKLNTDKNQKLRNTSNKTNKKKWSMHTTYKN
jgi:hypothetical protein